MKKVERSEILDFETYAEQRAETRPAVLEAKAKRRIGVGNTLTFLFENTETIHYQIQEMMRIERIVKERDIQHEIDTYNQLLGERGELGCTLLIEIDDAAERDEKLKSWLGLPEHLYMTLGDGRKVRPRWEAQQVGEVRLSSVQYLKFAIGEATPVAIGCDHPELTVEQGLSPEQQAVLAGDAES